tara:strand:+ start:9887 stop:10105 length:219 start_codon:yes stop_codon:yes gene_type:complete
VRPIRKIQFIRNEFFRIGCLVPPDVPAYRLNVDWDFGGICFCGKKVQTIDFDILIEILKLYQTTLGKIIFRK